MGHHVWRIPPGSGGDLLLADRPILLPCCFYTLIPTGVLGVQVLVRAWVPLDEHHTMFWSISVPRTRSQTGVMRSQHQWTTVRWQHRAATVPAQHHGLVRTLEACGRRLQ